MFYSIASYILPAIEKILGGINSILSVLDTTGGKIFFGFVTLASTVAAVVLSFKALYALYKDLRNIRAIIQGITAAQAAQNLAVQGEVIAQGELAAARGAANAANVGGGFMSSLTAINPGQILASAAAIAIVAGSFVL